MGSLSGVSRDAMSIIRQMAGKTQSYNLNNTTVHLESRPPHFTRLCMWKNPLLLCVFQYMKVEEIIRLLQACTYILWMARVHLLREIRREEWDKVYWWIRDKEEKLSQEEGYFKDELMMAVIPRRRFLSPLPTRPTRSTLRATTRTRVVTPRPRLDPTPVRIRRRGALPLTEQEERNERRVTIRRRDYPVRGRPIHRERRKCREIRPEVIGKRRQNAWQRKRAKEREKELREQKKRERTIRVRLEVIRDGEEERHAEEVEVERKILPIRLWVDKMEDLLGDVVEEHMKDGEEGDQKMRQFEEKMLTVQEEIEDIVTLGEYGSRHLMQNRSLMMCMKVLEGKSEVLARFRKIVYSSTIAKNLWRRFMLGRGGLMLPWERIGEFIIFVKEGRNGNWRKSKKGRREYGVWDKGGHGHGSRYGGLPRW
jgi:hypothetical protein